MRVTHYGYFGPSTNVRQAPMTAAQVDQAFALLDVLPRRRPVSRAPAATPLRFIAVTDLPGAPK